MNLDKLAYPETITMEKWDTHLSERRVAANGVAIAQGVCS